MAHLSANMIQELRLNTIRNDPKTAECTIIEGRRTLLACYCACAMLSLVIRRSTILPFSDFVSESLDIVRGSSEASPSDKSLVAWVELQRISVDLAEAKNTTTNATTAQNIDNMKIWLARTFESRLFNWKDVTRDEIQEDGLSSLCHSTDFAALLTAFGVVLMMEYHTIMLQANLLGISDRPQSPVAPPFTVEMISPKFTITDLPAFGKSIASAQAVLNLFLLFPPVDIPSIPGIVFPRMIHALLILMVAASTILGSSNNTPDRHNHLSGKDVADLEIPAYFNRIIEIFQRTPSPATGRPRVAAKLLSLLRKWYMVNILHEPEHLLASHPQPSSAMYQGNLISNMPSAILGGQMEVDNCFPLKDTQAANLGRENQPDDFQTNDAPNFDPTLGSGQLLPLREEQYAFFESLVESPEGPPWTLFDDAMAVFDFM